MSALEPQPQRATARRANGLGPIERPRVERRVGEIGIGAQIAAAVPPLGVRCVDRRCAARQRIGAEPGADQGGRVGLPLRLKLLQHLRAGPRAEVERGRYGRLNAGELRGAGERHPVIARVEIEGPIIEIAARDDAG